MPKPTDHQLLLSQGTDHRPSNGCKLFPPQLTREAPVGFRTTDSVMGGCTAWPPNDLGHADPVTHLLIFETPLFHDHVCHVIQKMLSFSNLRYVTLGGLPASSIGKLLSRKTECPESPLLCMLTVRSIWL